MNSLRLLLAQHRLLSAQLKAHPFIDNIKRKDFALSTPLTDQEITGDDLLDLVLQRLRATAPFVQLLSNAVGPP
jgi:hypothetical protein